MKGVELYAQVRFAVQIEGMSRREAARRFGIDPRTVAKMLAFSLPPGYRRRRPPVRPKLDSFIAPYVVHRLIQLMDSEDPRVATVACNAILDRGLGKPGPVKEEKDDLEARLANMTREERLALMQTMLERVRQYLPAAPKQRRLSSTSAG
jgi:hypothetical protein